MIGATIFLSVNILFIYTAFDMKQKLEETWKIWVYGILYCALTFFLNAVILTYSYDVYHVFDIKTYIPVIRIVTFILLFLPTFVYLNSGKDKNVKDTIISCITHMTLFSIAYYFFYLQ